MAETDSFGDSVNGVGCGENEVLDGDQTSSDKVENAQTGDNNYGKGSGEDFDPGESEPSAHSEKDDYTKQQANTNNAEKNDNAETKVDRTQHSVLTKKPPASSKANKKQEKEEDEDSLPQEVAKPFSLASFLSHMEPQVEDDASTSQKEESTEEQELAYVNGTFVRVSKERVDVEELDRRLDGMYRQRREEIELLKMYGLDDRRGPRTSEYMSDSQDGDREGRDSGRDRDGKGRSRDRDEKSRDRRRSRSRSRDRDRDRRRSRSRDRRRSRSRERRRSRSRSREDRHSRRDRDSSPERSRGRDDKDRFGRDKDRFGRDKDRFGRDRREPDRNRDRDREERDKEQKRSRSPRGDRRDSHRERQPMPEEEEEEDRYAKAGWRNNPGQNRGRGNRNDGGWGRGRNDRFRGNQRHMNEAGRGVGEFGSDMDQYPDYGEQRGDPHLPYGEQRGDLHPFGELRGDQYPPFGGQGSDQYNPFGEQKDDQQPPYGEQKDDQQPQFGEHKDDQRKDQQKSGRVGAFSAGKDLFQSQQQPQFQMPPLPVPPPDPFPQSQYGQGGIFTRPPPSLDPFASSTGVPQPWLGAGFQQQQQQQQPPPAPQQVPPPVGMVGDYSQPPPPLPASLNLLNNGNFDSLKKSLAILTGTADPNSPMGGSPALAATGTQGFGMNTTETSQSSQEEGEKYSGYGGESSFADSGMNDDDDPMDLDLPESTGGSSDFQDQVVHEVKNAIRPYFSNKQISKDEYKEILKKCVPKVTNSGEINQKKINNLVGAYVKKMKGGRSK